VVILKSELDEKNSEIQRLEDELAEVHSIYIDIGQITGFVAFF
jgi:hypothetical protein